MIAGLTMKSQADYFKGDNIDWMYMLLLWRKKLSPQTI